MATTLEQPASEQAKQDERLEVIRHDPGILGGRPVFPGTRMPVRTLFDVLMKGKPLDDFLEGFPTVSREQAVAVLRHACGVLDLEPTRVVRIRRGDEIDHVFYQPSFGEFDD